MLVADGQERKNRMSESEHADGRRVRRQFEQAGSPGRQARADGRLQRTRKAGGAYWPGKIPSATFALDQADGDVGDTAGFVGLDRNVLFGYRLE